MGTSSSILTSVILPVFGIISYTFAGVVNRKIRSELKSSALFFGGALFSSLVLLIMCMRPDFRPTLPGRIISVLSVALVTGCAHGINMMLVCELPVKFMKYGKISTVSGLLNAFTYVGSALSTYAIALIVDNKGWRFAIGSWAVTALLGAVMCIINVAYVGRRESSARD